MKKTPLKRINPWKRAYNEMGDAPKKSNRWATITGTGKKLTNKAALRAVARNESAQIKERLQADCRWIVIRRDGGCWLRHYPEAGACGGYRKDGELILQAEHLNTRADAVSFADTRLIVCICKRHHIYWKPQYSARYNELAREFIGPEHAAHWDRVKADNRPHHMTIGDWKLLEIALEQEKMKYNRPVQN